MGCSNRGRGLQGPRPSSLRVGNSSSTMMINKPSLNNRSRNNKAVHPVVIYLRSPKIIHVRPEEFMNLVQRLTGKDSTNDPALDDESMKGVSKRDNLLDGGDQIIGMSPTWSRLSAWHCGCCFKMHILHFLLIFSWMENTLLILNPNSIQSQHQAQKTA